jgi:cystathionine beta-lyase/cystathionine gamma-synthase
MRLSCEEAGPGSPDRAIYTGDMAAQGTGRLPIGEHQITSVLSAVRPETGARAMPISASTSFGFGDDPYAAGLFARQTRGNTYIRVDDPTSAEFEERPASREGGLGAVAPSFGQAVQRIGLLALCQKGDQVAAPSPYRNRAVQAANLMVGVDETDGQLVSGWMR